MNELAKFDNEMLESSSLRDALLEGLLPITLLKFTTFLNAIHF